MPCLAPYFCWRFSMSKKTAQKEHKPSRIEQIFEDMLKEIEIKKKRIKRLEELTNNINK